MSPAASFGMPLLSHMLYRAEGALTWSAPAAKTQTSRAVPVHAPCSGAMVADCGHLTVTLLAVTLLTVTLLTVTLLTTLDWLADHPAMLLPAVFAP